MIRLLLDMGIAQSTGRHLRASGHDVVHLLDEELASLPDDRIVAKAQEEGRAIVTHDLDFGRIEGHQGPSAPDRRALSQAEIYTHPRSRHAWATRLMAMTYAASRGKSFRFFASSLTAWKAAVILVSRRARTSSFSQ